MAGRNLHFHDFDFEDPTSKNDQIVVGKVGERLIDFFKCLQGNIRACRSKMDQKIKNRPFLAS